MQVITQFLKMETLLDDSVNEKMELQIERGGKSLTVDLQVRVIHSWNLFFSDLPPFVGASILSIGSINRLILAPTLFLKTKAYWEVRPTFIIQLSTNLILPFMCTPLQQNGQQELS